MMNKWDLMRITKIILCVDGQWRNIFWYIILAINDQLSDIARIHLTVGTNAFKYRGISWALGVRYRTLDQSSHKFGLQRVRISWLQINNGCITNRSPWESSHALRRSKIVWVQFTKFAMSFAESARKENTRGICIHINNRELWYEADASCFWKEDQLLW